MTFPLEKILTVSAKDYCDSIGKQLSDYELKGVIVFEEGWTMEGILFNKKFTKNIPKGTEVIVSFNYSLKNMSGQVTYAGGTALIPKRKEEENMGKMK